MSMNSPYISSMQQNFDFHNVLSACCIYAFYLWVPVHLGCSDTEDMDFLAPLIIEDIYATVREGGKIK